MQLVRRKKILFSIAFFCLVFGIFCLVQIFSGRWVLQQSFSLGVLTIHYYGITMALAVGAGWWLALRRAPGYGFTARQADSLFQWVVVWGFVGARLYHVVSSWQYYRQYPLDIFKVWHGGLSIFGALIGGFLVVVIFVRIHERVTRFDKTPAVIPPLENSLGMTRGEVGDIQQSAFPPHGQVDDEATTFSLLHVLDWLIPSVVLGQIIGRFGNFFNYEAFGYPTVWPWKMFVPIQFRPVELAQYAFFHPLFLYEALGNMLVLSVLLLLSKRKNLAAGSLFFLYLFLYNALRFALEFLRVDSTFLWGFIRLNTLSSALLCLIGSGGIVYTYVYAAKPKAHMEQI